MQNDTPQLNLEEELMDELDELFESFDACKVVEELREECQRSSLPNEKFDNY